MNDSMRFISAFLRQPTKIGAVAPSSPWLARAMVADLQVGSDQAVLEFGPGTGPFTQALVETLPAGARYMGIELHAGFVQRLQRRWPGHTFVQGSAADAARLHREQQLPPVKAVVCGLPFASLPPSVQDGVIASLDELISPGSEFRTFQYVHAYGLPTAIRFRRRMAQLFGRCERRGPILRNLPPAYVLRWTR